MTNRKIGILLSFGDFILVPARCPKEKRMYISGNETESTRGGNKQVRISQLVCSVRICSVSLTVRSRTEEAAARCLSEKRGLKGVVLITHRPSGAAQVMILNTFVGRTEGS